ncbi:hypothetical protein BDW71DRAFT_211500 [Aspergillus fruticulosus]
MGFSIGTLRENKALFNKLTQLLKTLVALIRPQPDIILNEQADAAVSENKSEYEELWRHPDPRGTQMWEFLQQVNQRHATAIRTYQELHRWSLENITDFWVEAWDYCGIRYSRLYEQVVEDEKTMWPRPAWFKGAQLNYAENLLFPTQGVSENSVAVISVTETEREFTTWSELRERVRACQAGMRAMDVKPGERVAGYVANHSYALVAMLATVSLGAIWTAVSPDTGVTAALDRLAQVQPRLLFTDNAVVYNAKRFDVLDKAMEIISGLPSLEAAVVLRTIDGLEDSIVMKSSTQTKTWTYENFIAQAETDGRREKLEFVQMPAEHPVYILYSSGSTGNPKCIVHGAIGTLIQHKKEHILQSDIWPGDRLCYITTCMWMMWHWLVSGLASGATVVLYNGSPFYYRHGTEGTTPMPYRDDLAMLKLVDELKVTQFGASATYYSTLERRRLMPKQFGLSLESLKAIYSTGSPLAPSTFRYIYEACGPQVNLGSISGGTDIISDFGTPCPLQPVFAGEIQAVALGMAVEVWSPMQTNLSDTGEPGELVCVRPFPSQPVQFWGPNGAEKYEAAYFEKFAGVWAHGDFVRLNSRTGGLVMLGRSDGVLNPKGVRFGSAEIYSLLLRRFPTRIEDSLCIGRRRGRDADETVVLFLKMREGSPFSAGLAEEVRRAVREELSPRHVPGVISECPEIPVTANGKKVEVLVKKILGGGDVEGQQLANIDCLEWFRQWAQSH